MKVTLAMVVSADGRSTQGDQPGTGSWASAEDQTEFREFIASHDSVVMGSATYLAARAVLQPSADKPRIVLTRTPDMYTEAALQPGLEFTAESPREVIARLSARGCQKLLLVGGAETNARFLDAGIVNELVVTVEPLLFGAGRPFTDALQQPVQLRLVSCKQLNTSGTLLFHYLVNQPNLTEEPES